MTNDNETVREVCDSLYRVGNSYLENYADRILAAHEREMAAKDAEIAKHERCYRALEVHCKKLEEEYLRATNALKPVLEVNLAGLENYGIDYKSLLAAIIADAQNIYKERETK